jgi:hypothetical protein
MFGDVVIYLVGEQKISSDKLSGLGDWFAEG